MIGTQIEKLAVAIGNRNIAQAIAAAVNFYAAGSGVDQYDNLYIRKGGHLKFVDEVLITRKGGDVTLMTSAVVGLGVGLKFHRSVRFFDSPGSPGRQTVTQTYSDASRDHPAVACIDLSYVGTPDTKTVAIVAQNTTNQATEITNNFASLIQQYAYLKDDLLNEKNRLNAILDDLQAYGLLQ